MNKVLMDRAMRRNMQDGRNPYGSRGGYVSSRRSRGGRGRDRDMADYNYGSERDRGYDMRYDREPMRADGHYPMERYGEHNRPMQYEMYGIGGMRPMNDYRGEDYGMYDYARGGRSSRGGRGDYNMNDYGYDYNYDYASYDYAKEDEEYKKELKEWTEKLKSKDRFGWAKENVIPKAKEMGVKFDHYTEDEFFATYLMQVSDYKNVSNDPHMYLVLAKQFLEDDDAKLKGSEKLCKYLYAIVLGEDD